MKTLIICFIVFILSLNYAFSQEKKYHITGTILDTNNIAITYATIKLDVLSADTITLGAISNENGKFRISNIPFSKAKMTVSFIGYVPFIKEIEPLEHLKQINFDTIVLEPDIYMLEEIQIVSNKTGLKSLVDMTVFVPDEKSIKASATGLDLLSKIPEIRVRIKDQQIIVAGDGKPLILINGASSDRIISTINPRDIKKIEVIKNPPSQYESDISSVINIVLKPERETGLHIASNLEYSFVNLVNNSNAQIDYIFNRFRTFISYRTNIFSENDVFYSRHRIENDGESLIEVLTNASEDSFHRNNHHFQYGVDYQLNDRNTVSFTGNYILNDYKTKQQLHSNKIVNNQNYMHMLNSSKIYSEAIQHNYNLFYIKKFLQPNHELKLNSNLFLMNRTRKDFHSDSTFYLSDYTGYGSKRNEQTFNDLLSLNVKLDYLHPFGDHITLSGGYQFYQRIIENNYIALNQNSIIDYNDLRNSVYTDVRLKKGNFAMRAGIRLENLRISIYDTITNHNIYPLPSGAIMYSFNNNNNLTLSYNKRLRYPMYQMLVPFKYFSGDSISVISGNPNLKPEKQHRLSLRYSYNTRKWNITTTAYYAHLSELFGMVHSMEQNILKSKWSNINKANRLGFNISAKLNIFDAIDVSFYTDIYQSYYPASQYNGLSYNSILSLDTYLPADIVLGLETIIGFRESRVDMYIYESPFVEQIYLRKDILDGNGSISFSMIQPFFTVDVEYKRKDDSFSEVYLDKHYNPAYQIKFTYFFSRGKRTERLRKEIIMEEEQIN